MKADDRSEIVAETEMKQKVAKGLFWKLLETAEPRACSLLLRFCWHGF